MSIFDFLGRFFSVTQLLVTVVILILLFAYVNIRNLLSSKYPHKHETYENFEVAHHDKHKNLSRTQMNSIDINSISSEIVIDKIATSEDLNPLYNNWDSNLSIDVNIGSMGKDSLIDSSLDDVSLSSSLDDVSLSSSLDDDMLSSFDDDMLSSFDDDMLSSFDD